MNGPHLLIWTIYFLSGRHVYASSKTHIVYESWKPDPPNLGGSHNPYCTVAYLDEEEDMVRWWAVNIHSFYLNNYVDIICHFFAS